MKNVILFAELVVSWAVSRQEGRATVQPCFDIGDYLTVALAADSAIKGSELFHREVFRQAGGWG